MEQSINKSELLSRVLAMIDKQHARMDAHGTSNHEVKLQADGHLEALYQVENLILNWGNEHEAIKQTV